MTSAVISLTAAALALRHVFARNKRLALAAEQQQRLEQWRAWWRDAAAKGQFLIKESDFSFGLQPYGNVALVRAGVAAA